MAIAIRVFLIMILTVVLVGIVGRMIDKGGTRPGSGQD